MKTAYSKSSDPTQAVAALREDLADDPKLVLYFLSAGRDAQVTAALMCETFPTAITLGCTTAGELADDRMLTGALVACALYDDDLFAAHAVHVEDPGDSDAVRRALSDIDVALGGDCRRGARVASLRTDCRT